MGHHKNAFIEALNISPKGGDLYADLIEDLSDNDFINLSRLFNQSTGEEKINILLKHYPSSSSNSYFTFHKRTIKKKRYSFGFNLFNGNPVAPIEAYRIMDKASIKVGKELAGFKMIDVEERAEETYPDLRPSDLSAFLETEIHELKTDSVYTEPLQKWFDAGLNSALRGKAWADPLSFQREWEGIKDLLGEILEALADGIAAGIAIKQLRRYIEQLQAGQVPDPFKRFENSTEIDIPKGKESKPINKIGGQGQTVKKQNQSKRNSNISFENKSLRDLWIDDKIKFDRLIKMLLSEDIIEEKKNGYKWKVNVRAFRYLFDELRSNKFIPDNPGGERSQYDATEIDKIAKATFIEFPKKSVKNLHPGAFTEWKPVKRSKGNSKEDLSDKIDIANLRIGII